MTGVVCDIDGVLWIGGQPGVGAREFIADLVRGGYPCVLLTNDCSVSQSARREELIAAGFPAGGWELISASGLIADHLVAQNVRTICALGYAEAFLPSSVSVTTDPEAAEAVVVGDCFRSFDVGAVGPALSALERGVPFLAAQRNATWSDGLHTHPDNGFFIAGLEYCAGRPATILGKPEPAAYHAALRRIGCSADDAVFISDSESEVAAGAELGFDTIHFTTPRHFSDALARAETLREAQCCVA
jgi:phospholysine phosphohistidine inorganic pyrophosphate phosphatase